MTDAPPEPVQAVASTPPVTVTQAEQPRAWHWSIVATLVMPILVMGILIWQLMQLQPSKWCGVAIGSTKLTDQNQLPAVQSCFNLLTSLIEIYRVNTLALIVVIAICIIAIVVTTVKARLNVEAWGFHGGVGSDNGKDPG